MSGYLMPQVEVYDPSVDVAAGALDAVSALNPAVRAPKGSTITPYQEAQLMRQLYGGDNARFPTLDLSSSANWSEGLAKAAGNVMGIRQHRQQQARDLATSQALQQQIQDQRDLAAAQIAQEEKRQQVILETKLNDPRYGRTPEERQQNVAFDLATGGGFGKKLAEGLGEGAGKVEGVMWQNHYLPDASAFNTSTPTPSDLNTYHRITGHAPTTLQDVNSKDLANQTADVKLQQEKNTLTAQPTVIRQDLAKGQQDITKNQLDIQIKGVEAQFAEAEKRASIANKNLQNQKDRQALTDTANGRNLFQKLQKSGDLYTTDPAKQAQIQAQLGVFGVKWNPPNSSYKSVKDKSGKIWLLDENSGQVGQLDKNGKVTKWQSLQPE